MKSFAERHKSKLTFSCSKSTIETLEKCVKYAQINVNNKNTRASINFNCDMVNNKEFYIWRKFHIYFLCQIKHPCKQLAFEIMEAFVTALKILFICKIFKRIFFWLNFRHAVCNLTKINTLCRYFSKLAAYFREKYFPRQPLVDYTFFISKAIFQAIFTYCPRVNSWFA